MLWSRGRAVIVFIFFGGSLVSVAGCGQNPYATARVTGSVLCDGAPAHGGVVVFMPVDDPSTGRPKGAPGRPATGLVGPDGKFSLMLSAAGNEREKVGALLGPNEVSFRPGRSEPWEIADEDKGLPPDQVAKLKAEVAKRPVYPPLKCGALIAPSSVQVKSGNNVFDFTLQTLSAEEIAKAEQRKERISRRQRADEPSSNESAKESTNESPKE